MAKRRRLSKNQLHVLKTYLLPVILVLIGLLIGVCLQSYRQHRQSPKNLVWAIDSSVQVPDDLRKFLLTQDNCKNYRGQDAPSGVGLWGVIQVTDRFAKISYGCSWTLTNYILAYKQNSAWHLISAEEYFGAAHVSGIAIPACKVLTTYKIPQAIEPFCINTKGKAETNKL